MQPESLVVIRTYADVLHADQAQVELLAAGIYSLLVADESAPLHAGAPPGPPVALAVHRRDVEVAESVLTPTP